jgi:hypothetical protein
VQKLNIPSLSVAASKRKTFMERAVSSKKHEICCHAIFFKAPSFELNYKDTAWLVLTTLHEQLTR